MTTFGSLLSQTLFWISSSRSLLEVYVMKEPNAPICLLIFKIFLVFYKVGSLGFSTLKNVNNQYTPQKTWLVGFAKVILI